MKKILLYSTLSLGILLTGVSLANGAGDITITSPARSVVAAPEVATLAITDENNKTFYIPYIQTSPNLMVSANVATSALPAGGSVKFVLNQGLSGEQVQYGITAPFSAQFNNLSKAEYTLDVYIVDSSRNVYGAGHDKAIRIGIGDIITAIGDSITEGYNGKMCGSTPITNWLAVPSKCSASKDGRNFPQHGPTGGTYKQSWMTEMNDHLATAYGYPVFIMNEGVGGITAGKYLKRIQTNKRNWQTRQNNLKPNKWLIHLGVNDVNASVSASAFKTNITSIVNILNTSYGAKPQSIYMSYPMYWGGKTARYLPVVDSLVNTEKIVSMGPDFFGYYKKYPNYVPNGHPSVAGVTQMARLWALSMVYPQNFTVSQNGDSVDLNWNAVPQELGVGGYKVKYGTSTDNYSNIVDAGNSLSKQITGLVDGLTYYFTVTAYDNDPKFVSESAKAPIRDLTYRYAPETPPAIPDIVENIENEPVAELAPVIIPEILIPINPIVINNQQNQEINPAPSPNNKTKKEQRREEREQKREEKKEARQNQTVQKSNPLKEFFARQKNKSNK